MTLTSTMACMALTPALPCLASCRVWLYSDKVTGQATGEATITYTSHADQVLEGGLVQGRLAEKLKVHSSKHSESANVGCTVL